MKLIIFIIVTTFLGDYWQLRAGEIISSPSDGIIYYDNGHTKIPIIKIKGQNPRTICKQNGYIWFQMGSQIIDSECNAIYRLNEEKLLLDMFSVDGGQLVGTTLKYFVFEMNLNDEGKGFWLFNVDTLQYKPIELLHSPDESISLENDSLICSLKTKKISIRLNQLWKKDWWQPRTPPAQ